MKKIIAVLLIACTLILLCSCGSKKAYEDKAQDFAAYGIKIKLTQAFKEKSYSGYTICYDAKDVAVFILKETFAEKVGFNRLTVKEYAEKIRKANEEKQPSEVVHEGGLTYIEYEFYNKNESLTYKYLTVTYKGVDAFWLVQFACDVKDYNEYKPYFIEWAKTVDVSVKYEGENSGIGAVNNQKY